jgi:hypothetical protein
MVYAHFLERSPILSEIESFAAHYNNNNELIKDLIEWNMKINNEKIEL